ncbi:oligosaccharide MFS transporter [Bartonella tamiae]|uniref:Oligosaccharide:H+ symporter n=1 Tax=Bartonella tamiae Th239 TaxID=1094558 RepID=J1JVU6_9HYPH|nr:oligosaccharide MFS transporter [Bartonella tamiae]EJF89097.1 oligosaccharide:H+ symporter [Bartonella tamiae Th239]EJF94653.1 oligosaccharide:H+ symporter [Bartonella tamiae Th307]
MINVTQSLSYFKNRYYRYASGYSGLFFIAWSLWWSLYAIWLKNTIGLTGTQVGMLYSVNQFTSIIVMIAYGILQDKLGLRKNLVWLIGIVIALTGPFLIYIYEPLLRNNFMIGLIIGSIFFGLGYLAASGLLESFTEKMARAFNFEYGTSRAWGSFGYAVGALFAGIFFTINPHINFWLVSLFGVIFLIINTRFKSQDAVEVTKNAQKISGEDFFAVFKNLKFWIFVIFITGTWSFYNVYDQQMFPPFYQGLFDSEEKGIQVYGYLNSFQVVLEAMVMATIPFFVNKVGAKSALLTGGVIMICRIFVSASSESISIISFVKLFHAIEVPLFVIAVFKYIVSNFDSRLSATIYLIGFQIASSLGIVILSTPVGMMFDEYGYHTVFYSFSAIVVVMLIFGFLFLSNADDKKLNKDPIIEKGS